VRRNIAFYPYEMALKEIKCCFAANSNSIQPLARFVKMQKISGLPKTG